MDSDYFPYAEAVAVATIIMSIPLLLSFNIKYQWLPSGDVWGYVYGCLFFWGLLSIWTVPFLLAALIVLTLRIRNRSILTLNFWGIAIALLAEIIFIAARLSPPQL